MRGCFFEKLFGKYWTGLSEGAQVMKETSEVPGEAPFLTAGMVVRGISAKQSIAR